MSAIIEHTPEWYEARRTGITSTDIPAILGLSRWASEGDVARDKQGAAPQQQDAAAERRMRVGTAVQDVIKAEDEVEHGIKLRRIRRLIVHPSIDWALTSLDFERVGERTIVEAKSSASREWDDGLPERVEAQVRWQMGVAGYPAAHVAVLRYGNRLQCFDVEHDAETFRNLVTVAADFRERLDAGGPFDESRESIRRAWPYDDGSEITASPDPELVEAVRDLLRTRANLKQVEDREAALVAAIQTRMGPASVLTGPGFRITWRRSKDSTETAWKLIAESLLRTLADDEREAIVSLHSTTKDGKRPFILRETNPEKETQE